MVRGNIKRALSALLAIVVVVGTIDISSYAKDNGLSYENEEIEVVTYSAIDIDDNSEVDKRGLEETSVSEEYLIEKWEKEIKDEVGKNEEKLCRTMYMSSEWDKYTNYYLYNRLNETQRKLCDILYDKLMGYMYDDATYIIDSYGAPQVSAYIRGEYLTYQELRQVYDFIKYGCPQLFFVDNYTVMSTGTNGKYLAGLGVIIIDEFRDGTKRAEAVAKMEEQLAAWREEILKEKTEEDKERKIYDILLENIEYDENAKYSQSSYSAIVNKSTVCVGYASAFAMLCNSVGLECVQVTSNDHQWNKVKVNGVWYNADVTWDDKKTVEYRYYNRSDNWMETDVFAQIGHVMLDMWNGYVPVCLVDVGGNATDGPGKLEERNGVVEKPIIEFNKGERTATITCDTEDSIIYYTLDGTTPSESLTKGYVYTEPIKLGVGDTLSAIGVKSGKYDSEVAINEEMTNELCMVHFSKENDEVGETPTSIKVNCHDFIKLPNNPYTKEHYTFVGWSDGDNTYSEGEMYPVSKENVEFSAVWQGNKSKVTFIVEEDGQEKIIKDVECRVNDRIELPENNYEREGYINEGWYDGQCTYGENENFYIVKSEVAAVRIKWKAKTIIYKYDYSLKQDGSEISKYNGVYDEIITLNEPYKKKMGYKCVGWTDGINVYEIGSQYTLKEEVEFKAIWQEAKGKITFTGGEGAIGDGPEEVLKDYYTEYTMPSNPYKKQGYTFVCWTDGKGNYYPNRAFVVKEDNVEFMAVWEPNGVVMYYDYYNCGYSVDSYYDYRYDSTISLPAAPEMEGYDFQYWSISADGYNEICRLMPYDEYKIQSIKLYVKAVWKKVENSNSDDSNGESSAENNINNNDNNSNNQEQNSDSSNNDSNSNNHEEKVKSIKLSAISNKVAAGKKVKITADIIGGQDCKLEWSTSNKKYAKVSKNGVVTTLAKGKGKTVTITAKATDGSNVIASYKIKIMKNAVKKISLSTKNKTVKVGAEVKIKAKVTPNDGINTKLIWTSSNDKYAIVNSKGVVKVLKKGKGKTVTITAKATDGSNKKAKIKLKIKK